MTAMSLRADPLPVVRTDADSIAFAARHFRQTVEIVSDPEARQLGVRFEGDPGFGDGAMVARLAPIYPEWLGDRGFLEAHAIRFPYVVGEMARGIATAEMVIAAGQAGLLGFYGAAGQTPERIEAETARISAALEPAARSWGSNLIHTPDDPALEQKIVDLYLARHVRKVSASAFMALTPAVVRYSASGLGRRPDGSIERRNALFAKISRPEVAEQFLKPPERTILDALVAASLLTRDEAELAASVPVATDVTAEADSGGHTDNRPLSVLLPQIARLRDDVSRRHGYREWPRVGAGGGIGTPSAVAAAFAMGAAYVLTGSVNQAAVESGLAPVARAMLAAAGPADVAMCPSADMFEMGVKVQVLKRGTLFAMRAARLYDLYKSHASLEDISAGERAQLERDLFRAPLDRIWAETEAFFAARDPAQAERARHDPKHRMALVFRWYLGQSSRWPIQGAEDRRLDFQIWCGPAMGAFNEWSAGSFLAQPDNRTVVQIALNLLEGGAAVTRANQLRAMGVAVPDACFSPVPRSLAVG